LSQATSNFAQFLTSVKNVLNDTGEKIDALQMHQESFATYVSLHGKKYHADTAISMNNITLVMHEMGHEEEALKVHEEVLKIKEAVFGKKHAETADKMNNMAASMYQLGQKEEALQVYKETLAIQESIFGDRNHASIKYNAQYGGRDG